MKLNPAFHKQVLTICLGISAVLLSASLLVFSVGHVQPAQAAPINKAPWDTELRGGVGLGIVKDTGYFVIWAHPNKFYKVDITKASDWYKEE